ncbi:hypothetical protein GCM10027271_32160 [Saccharopolyspora gloriosae]|uniref:Uncharacterized protein n=1 Tax=Saccharopolyspora gloriosae TaxID=455344 RepID=A0A840NNQ4_9PSEU|nr:hypothetical protein [Saccharopolyspora gloriosae]MBB5069887.1 hypothetical protein [Saccharopolyspora gloriosae]
MLGAGPRAAQRSRRAPATGPALIRRLLGQAVSPSAEAVALAGAGAVVSAAGGLRGAEFAGALHLVCAVLAALAAISAVAVLVLARC